MPASSYSVTDFPFLLSFTNCDNITNTFVAGNDWEAVAKSSMLGSSVGVADTAS
jgi:hypothetical protein